MYRSFFHVLTIALVLMTMVSSPAQAQDKKDQKLEDPVPVTLHTKDNLDLTGVYLKSNKGKEAVPVLLIHEWEGQMSPYAKLCRALQQSGCAVLAMDYRGHGRSNKFINARGKEETFKVKTMNRRDVDAIMRADLEAAKRFLKEKNNAGELNLNALILLSVGDGSVLSANWTKVDWSFPSVGSRKQGQDVKGLILVAPKRVLKGVTVDAGLNDPRVAALPMLITYAKESPDAGDAERIAGRMEAVKRRFKDDDSLQVVAVSGGGGGPALMNQSQSAVRAVIEFAKTQVPVSEQENPWIERP